MENVKGPSQAKVGIITFHKSINYGSALQAWALSYVLEKMGADPRIIDFEPAHYKDLYSLFYPPCSRSAVSTDLLHLYALPYFARRQRDFSRFRRDHLPLDHVTYVSGDDISAFAADKDVMICGSDQIWNPRARDFDRTFLLGSLTDVKKVSYAVSINKSTFEDTADRDYIRSCLLDFAHLSMRERSGAEAVHELIGPDVPVEVTLDPTLLVSKDDLESVAAPGAVRRPYIFFYSVRLNRSAAKAVTGFARKTGLPVYTAVSGKGNLDIVRNRKNIHLAPGDAGPAGFLGLIRDAEYVVTDSFHGTALSVVFEKEFYAVNDEYGRGRTRDDNRIMQLLSSLDLEDRHIPASLIKNTDLTKKIDYAEVTRRRKELADSSIRYLENAVWNEEGFPDR